MSFYVKNRDDQPKSQLLQLRADDKTYHLTVLSAGTEIFLPQRYDHQHQLPEAQSKNVYSLFLFTEGQYYFRLGSEIKSFSPGTLVLIPPNEQHWLGPYRWRTQISYKWVSFVIEDTEGYSLEIPYHLLLGNYFGTSLADFPSCHQLDGHQTLQIIDLIDLLVENFNRSDHLAHFYGMYSMLDIFATLLEFFEVEAPEESDPLLRVKELLVANCPNSYTVGDLAEYAGLSTGYFIKCFKNQYGKSPIAYQLELRVNAAKTLLMTTGMSIADIADRVGFSNLYYFSKAFKQIVGKSPSGYRKQQWTQQE